MSSRFIVHISFYAIPSFQSYYKFDKRVEAFFKRISPSENDCISRVGFTSIAARIFLGGNGMWRRRLYHRCEELSEGKVSERRRRRKNGLEVGRKTGSRNPADFQLPPLFPPPLCIFLFLFFFLPPFGIFVRPMGNRPKRSRPKQVFKDLHVSKNSYFG